MANPTKATWTDPTTNTDGTAVSTGEITGYTVGVRNTAATGSVAGTYPYSASAPAGATSELLSALTPTLPTGVLLAGAVQALSSSNGNSAWSTEATFTLTAPPSPPAGFSVA